jgi:hypothetical protein
LLIGDVVGKPGRQILKDNVSHLIMDQSIDLVIANGENAAAGSGITPQIYAELIGAGVDGITLGDHIYRRKEIIPILESRDNIVRPANYPHLAPGKDHMILTARNDVRVAVISLMGRVFMKPVDCPWNAADRILGNLPPDVKTILVDFHAEATSDKQLMGRYLDGRVSAVLGTHTHVTTADEEILPGGTAFQCDVGMTGPHLSIIGRRIDRILETTLTFTPTPFDVADRDVRLSATMVDVDPATGQATAIRRLSIRRKDPQLARTAAAVQSEEDTLLD